MVEPQGQRPDPRETGTNPIAAHQELTELFRQHGYQLAIYGRAGVLLSSTDSELLCEIAGDSGVRTVSVMRKGARSPEDIPHSLYEINDPAIEEHLLVVKPYGVTAEPKNGPSKQSDIDAAGLTESTLEEIKGPHVRYSRRIHPPDLGHIPVTWYTRKDGNMGAFVPPIRTVRRSQPQ